MARAVIDRELGLDHGPLIPHRFWREKAVIAALTDLDIGTLIRLVRVRFPLTQHQVARLTGRSYGWVHSRLAVAGARIRPRGGRPKWNCGRDSERQ